MSYLVLARKWRPQSFEEVVAQPQVVQTLQNAIRLNRIPHALLLTGSRGVGKTTVARLLAKALSCTREDQPTPHPCNECDRCLEITAGTAVDVSEIDGASNRSIDDVRELRDNVQYMPAKGRYKVYIIDEVHMLTREAFNALLKTLEEPPEHVIFIFATTEAHKIPITILSRCQRFDFRRIPLGELRQQIEKLTEAEGVQLSESAITLVARAAEGGMRDCLSLLDQVISFGGSEPSDEEVAQAIGAIHRSLLLRLGEGLLRHDPQTCLQSIEQVFSWGHDIRQFTKELATFLRDLMVVRVCKDPSEIIEISEEELQQLQKMGSAVSPELIQQMFRILTESAEEISLSSHPRLLLEMTLIRMARLEPVRSFDEILQQLVLLQEQISGWDEGGEGGERPGGERSPQAEKNSRGSSFQQAQSPDQSGALSEPSGPSLVSSPSPTSRPPPTSPKAPTADDATPLRQEASFSLVDGEPNRSNFSELFEHFSQPTPAAVLPSRTDVSSASSLESSAPHPDPVLASSRGSPSPTPDTGPPKTASDPPSSSAPMTQRALSSASVEVPGTSPQEESVPPQREETPQPPSKEEWVPSESSQPASGANAAAFVEEGEPASESHEGQSLFDEEALVEEGSPAYSTEEAFALPPAEKGIVVSVECSDPGAPEQPSASVECHESAEPDLPLSSAPGLASSSAEGAPPSSLSGRGRDWSKLVEAIRSQKPMLAGVLEFARCEKWGDSELILSFANDEQGSFYKGQADDNENRSFLRSFLGEQGWSGQIAIRLYEPNEQPGAPHQESITETRQRLKEELQQNLQEEVDRHPQIQNILKIFPGCEIVDIRPLASQQLASQEAALKENSLTEESAMVAEGYVGATEEEVDETLLGE